MKQLKLSHIAMIIKGLPREVHAVLLDFDGTIIDLRPKWWQPIELAFKDTAGYVPEEKLRKNVGDLVQKVPAKPSKFFLLTLLWEIGRGGGLSRLQTIKFLFRARRNFSKSRYTNIPLEGALEFIKILKENNIQTAIVTTANSKEMESAIEDIELIKSLVIISRDDVGELKPSPEPINLALERLDSSAEFSVMIGDFSSDIEAGKNAGTMTIGLSGFLPEVSTPRLQEADPDLIVPYLSDLVERIDN